MKHVFSIFIFFICVLVITGVLLTMAALASVVAGPAKKATPAKQAGLATIIDSAALHYEDKVFSLRFSTSPGSDAVRRFSRPLPVSPLAIALIALVVVMGCLITLLSALSRALRSAANGLLKAVFWMAGFGWPRYHGKHSRQTGVFTSF